MVTVWHCEIDGEQYFHFVFRSARACVYVCIFAIESTTRWQCIESNRCLCYIVPTSLFHKPHSFVVQLIRSHILWKISHFAEIFLCAPPCTFYRRLGMVMTVTKAILIFLLLYLAHLFEPSHVLMLQHIGFSRVFVYYLLPIIRNFNKIF